jgi:hypothetical protein
VKAAGENVYASTDFMIYDRKIKGVFGIEVLELKIKINAYLSKWLLRFSRAGGVGMS